MLLMKRLKLEITVCLFVIIVPFCLSAQNPGCDMQRARQAMSKEQFRDVLSILNECENSPDVYALRGTAYHNLYMPDSTIANLSAAIKGGLDDSEIQIRIAQAYLWKKDFGNAAKHLKQVTQEDRPDYRLTLAQLHELMGEYEKSLDLLNKILQKDPKHTQSRMKKAAVLSWMKNFDESISLYTDIINDTKVSESVRIQAKIKRAEVLSWQKKFDQALSELDEVVVTDKKNCDARLLKAQILEWRGEYKKAKNLYKDVLLIEPENKQAQIRLEKLLWVK